MLLRIWARVAPGALRFQKLRWRGVANIAPAANNVKTRDELAPVLGSASAVEDVFAPRTTSALPAPSSAEKAMPAWQLLVDSREPECVISPLLDRGARIQALPAGDFWVTDQTTALGAADAVPVLIVERKTVSDLMQALVTGRWKSQVRKLLYYREAYGTHVVLVVEGTWTPRVRWAAGLRQLQGLLRNAALFGPFPVHRTFTTRETLESVEHFARKMAPENLAKRRERDSAAGDGDTGSPVFAMELSPREGPAPDDAAATSRQLVPPNEALLIAVHGVSPVRAKRIAAVYPTLRALVDAFKAQEAAAEAHARLPVQQQRAQKRPAPAERLLQDQVGLDGRPLAGPKLSAALHAVCTGRGGRAHVPVWAAMLEQIRGVSPAIAQAISLEYVSPQALLGAFAASAAPERLLEGLAVSPERRIGRTLAPKIYSVLCGRVSSVGSSSGSVEGFQ